MANTSYSYTFDQHLNNILTSLAHRLEAAKAANNVQLIKLLEREKAEVTAPIATQRATVTWQALIQSFFNRSAQPIHRFENGSDRWWYTIDPRTGREVCADSEAELRLWIQQHSK
ncbi:MAG: hypothetical protein KME43_19470 [Myxacorys chilensis ATA2-1-KO14]|jgi:uncharacterized protein YejL (UPF0352 family)|nr:hypothetical protein [Myxacorys chilensis ATA2-1-KO14]